MEEKWKMLSKMEMNDVVIFGKHGCLTDTALHTLLKVRKPADNRLLNLLQNVLLLDVPSGVLHVKGRVP